jgi:hypothetical protein
MLIFGVIPYILIERKTFNSNGFSPNINHCQTKPVFPGNHKIPSKRSFYHKRHYYIEALKYMCELCNTL